VTQQVIIVGAPRSGTNMLRDVLTSADGVTTWPCDEINAVWKHGNMDIPHDEIPPERATAQTKAFLSRQFAARARRGRADVVVEKTCATSLRVPFVASALPDAKFIFIYRDGLDATASTMKRWNASFDPAYTLRKLRFVPATDLPRHLRDFLAKRLAQRFSGDSGREESDLKVSTWWGPRPRDFRSLQEHHPLEELAFIQWQRCVDLACAGLASLDPRRVHTIRYEDFVSDPQAGTAAALAFLAIEDRHDSVRLAQVSPRSVGKGRAALGPEAVERLEALAPWTLTRFGYA